MTGDLSALIVTFEVALVVVTHDVRRGVRRIEGRREKFGMGHAANPGMDGAIVTCHSRGHRGSRTRTLSSRRCDILDIFNLVAYRAATVR